MQIDNHGPCRFILKLQFLGIPVSSKGGMIKRNYQEDANTIMLSELKIRGSI